MLNKTYSIKSKGYAGFVDFILVVDIEMVVMFDQALFDYIKEVFF